ncbi:MAG: hypothetical protein Q8928_06640 [Bacteroidota bacterium]|nr:hypothetical protein [Bacteroidota bacterium]
MLKKVYHIFIVCLLILATSGVTVYRHYCSGTLVSTSLVDHEKSCCGAAHCKSCHNEAKQFKVIDNYNVSFFKTDFDGKSISIVLYSVETPEFLSEISTSSFIYPFSCASPPLITENAAALLQTFRC